MMLLSAVPAALLAALAVYLEMPFVSHEAIDQAMQAVRRSAGEMPKQGALIIVDYSQPSHTRRLAVLNLATGRAGHYCRVAHGKNTGTVMPENFSNQEGSLQSSLGLFKVEETFAGKHGLSLRLAGLEPGRNDKAFSRGIILHAAPYVSITSMLLNWRSGFRLGRSEGCFALADDDFTALHEMLVRPAYLYSYAKK
jgi:hypothetical protein